MKSQEGTEATIISLPCHWFRIKESMNRITWLMMTESSETRISWWKRHKKRTQQQVFICHWNHSSRGRRSGQTLRHSKESHRRCWDISFEIQVQEKSAKSRRRLRKPTIITHLLKSRVDCIGSILINPLLSNCKSTATSTKGYRMNIEWKSNEKQLWRRKDDCNHWLTCSQT